jgi:hypothetical protein
MEPCAQLGQEAAGGEVGDGIQHGLVGDADESWKKLFLILEKKAWNMCEFEKE